MKRGQAIQTEGTDRGEKCQLSKGINKKNKRVKVTRNEREAQTRQEKKRTKTVPYMNKVCEG